MKNESKMVTSMTIDRKWLDAVKVAAKADSRSVSSFIMVTMAKAIGYKL